MKQYFAKLKWELYSKYMNGGMPFTELDQFADHTFDNGISIRISVGKMANTIPDFPYEMVITCPGKHQVVLPKLNKHDVIVKMHEIDLKQVN